MKQAPEASLSEISSSFFLVASLKLQAGSYERQQLGRRAFFKEAEMVCVQHEVVPVPCVVE